MIGATGNNSNGGVYELGCDIMQVDMEWSHRIQCDCSVQLPYTMRNLYNTSGGTQGAFVVATNAFGALTVRTLRTTLVVRVLRRFGRCGHFELWCHGQQRQHRCGRHAHRMWFGLHGGGDGDQQQ